MTLDAPTIPLVHGEHAMSDKILKGRAKGWYITNHDRNDEVVRGPYQHAETAGAVRGEIESNWDDHDDERPCPNFWIVEVES